MNPQRELQLEAQIERLRMVLFKIASVQKTEADESWMGCGNEGDCYTAGYLNGWYDAGREAISALSERAASSNLWEVIRSAAVTYKAVATSQRDDRSLLLTRLVVDLAAELDWLTETEFKEEAEIATSSADV